MLIFTGLHGVISQKTELCDLMSDKAQNQDRTEVPVLMRRAALSSCCSVELQNIPATGDSVILI
jgi:hypothetical protein